MSVLGEAYVKVGAKDGGLSRDVEKIADDGGRRGGSRIGAALNGVRPGFTGIRRESATAFGEVAKNAAEAFGVAFAAVKTYDFIKDSIKDAQDYNTQVLRLQNSMRNNPALVHASSAAFEELASKLSETTTTSKTTALSGEAVLASFKLNQGQIERLLPAVNDYAQKFGVDLPTAARLFGRAATGSTGALSRLGVTIDKAKAKADPFGATMDALRAKAGGFAEDQGRTLTGRLGILRNAFEEVRVKVGNAVLPVLVALANFAVTKLMPVFEKIGEVIGEVAHWIAEQWRTLLEGFKDPGAENRLTGFARTAFAAGQMIAKAFTWIKNAWDDVVGGFQNPNATFGPAVSTFDRTFLRIGATIHKLVDVARQVYVVIKPYLVEIALALGLLVAPITTVVIALVLLYKHSQTFRDIISTVVSVVRKDFIPALSAIGQWITTNVLPVLRVLWTNVTQAFDKIVAAARTDWPAIRDIIRTVFTVIKVIIAVVVGTIIVLWRMFGSTILTVARNTFQTVMHVIQGALNVVLGIITVVLNLLTGHWSKAWQGVVQILRGVWQIITALVSGELSNLGAILGRLVSLVGAPFVAAWHLAESITQSVWNALVGLVRGYINALLWEVHAIEAVAGIIGGAFRSAYNAVVGAVGTLVHFVGGLGGKILGAIGDLGSLLYDAGKSIIEGLIHGVESMVPNVGGAMHAVASKIRSFLPFSPAKEGPLSGSGSPEIAGRKIVSMLAAGISSAQGDVGAAMGRVLGNGGSSGPSIIDNAIAGVPTGSAAARAAAAAAASSGSAAALAAAHLARQTELLEALVAATRAVPAGVGNELQVPSNRATLRTRGRVAGAPR